MATAEVVRYLRRKGASGFENITWLGSEQRFVAPLRNSSDNNLEEQFLLGTDTYIREYEDDNHTEEDPVTHTIVILPAYVTEKYFCILPENGNPTNEENYYKLITYKYKDALIPDSGYRFGGDSIYFPYKPNEVIQGDGSTDHPDLEALYCESVEVFDQYMEILQIFPTTSSTIQKDELWWVGTTGTMDKLISTKKTIVRYDRDMKITQEVITKSINS